MPTNFLPNKDAGLLAWATNFSTRITATPVAYGLVAAQATAFTGVLSPFSAALTTATNPATRTRSAVAAKDAAKKPLQALARDLARVVNAFPAITNAQRIDLGLTPRSGTVSPIQPPQNAPVLEVVGAVGRLLKIRLRTAGSTRRGFETGVAGATIFSYVGTTPPADISLWRFEGSTTRSSAEVEFSPMVPAGSQVFLTAFFFNPRAESGPACQPVSAYLAGGVTGTQQQAA